MAEVSFLPLLFGGDINVYSVARAFHEAYGVNSVAYGKSPGGPCADSSIIDYRVCPQNEDGPTFLANVTRFGEEHPDKTVIVMGCGDSYVRLCATYKDRFPKNCVAPCLSKELFDVITNKEEFYNLCDKYGIDHPATFIYRKEMGHDFELPFEPPYICKPASSYMYWEHPFEGNEKVFLLDTREQLETVLDKVYAAGYPSSMIIQEYVPGDDTYMWTLSCYSNRQGVVKLMCLGHVLLEEHSPHGRGNDAVIITQDNDKLTSSLKGLLDQVGFVGLSNFDIKYDRRDGKFKAFEVNCRQGRSNYHVTYAGQNLARWVVEDWIEGKEQPIVQHCEPIFWSVVPLKVAYKYTPKSYHPLMKRLQKAGKVANSLRYPADKGNLKKRLRFLVIQWRYFRDFKRYYNVPLDGVPHGTDD